MIIITNNHDGVDSPMRRTVSPAEALELLVEYELGYGGQELPERGDDQNLVVRTVVIGRVDTTTFHGPSNEVSLLKTAVDIFRALKGERAARTDQAVCRRSAEVRYLPPEVVRMAVELKVGAALVLVVYATLIALHFPYPSEIMSRVLPFVNRKDGPVAAATIWMKEWTPAETLEVLGVV